MLYRPLGISHLSSGKFVLPGLEAAIHWDISVPPDGTGFRVYMWGSDRNTFQLVPLPQKKDNVEKIR